MDKELKKEVDKFEEELEASKLDRKDVQEILDLMKPYYDEEDKPQKKQEPT